MNYSDLVLLEQLEVPQIFIMRNQLVEMKHSSNGTHSSNRILLKILFEQLPTRKGVPQGSTSGSILFLLLTNDLHQCTYSYYQVIMYADDTVVTLGNQKKDQLDSLIHTYIMIKQYCSNNYLVLNEKKICTIDPPH